MLADALREARPRCSPKDGSRGHREADGPEDDPADDKHGHGNGIDVEPAPVLEAVHGVDVAQPHHFEGGEHQDAGACAEIAAVDGDEELVNEVAAGWCGPFDVVGSRAMPDD